MNVNNVYPKVDRALDYIPGVSTVNSIIQLFLKRVYIPRATENKIQNSHYFSHVQDKSTWRCIAVFIPVLGNLIVAIYDLVKTLSSKKIEQPKQLTITERFELDPNSLNCQELAIVFRNRQNLSAPLSIDTFFAKIDKAWLDNDEFMNSCRATDPLAWSHASVRIRQRWNQEYLAQLRVRPQLAAPAAPVAAASASSSAQMRPIFASFDLEDDS